MEEINVFWFRRDLRLEDNCGLFHCLSQGKPVLLLFIFDKDILTSLDDTTDARVTFIFDALKSLKEQVKKYKSDVLIKHDRPLDAFRDLISKYKVHSVYTNEDYEPYAIKRDADVKDLLAQCNINFQSFKDQVIFDKSEVTKEDGLPYTVYTPYMKKWRSKLKQADLHVFDSNGLLGSLLKFSSTVEITLTSIGFSRSDRPIPSAKLDSTVLKIYAKNRDIPSLDATSKVGLYLRFGTLGIRQLFADVWDKSDVFVNELIWREFFMQILYHFPHVVTKSFKKKYDAIEWRNDEEEFQKWCDGNTGFPIVDAGMRELNATGFMHNRVRMITASFLIKDLLIDWRWGEAYFASKLLDFELSSNNGNWQWAAGSGCDAAPYFRVFNPNAQLKKFDPKGEYVRKWVKDFDSLAYPKPMIDHDFARKRVLDVYKQALS